MKPDKPKRPDRQDKPNRPDRPERNRETFTVNRETKKRQLKAKSPLIPLYKRGIKKAIEKIKEKDSRGLKGKNPPYSPFSKGGHRGIRKKG